MTNRDKQLIEAAIVQVGGPLSEAAAEKIVTLRYGEYELKYSWDEQSGYKFEWSIPEKWYVSVYSLAYYLYHERGKEVREYRMGYDVDPSTLQPVLTARFMNSFKSTDGSWKGKKRLYTPNDRELEAIARGSAI